MSQLKVEGDHPSNTKPISPHAKSKLASYGIPEVVNPADPRAHLQVGLNLNVIDAKSELLSKLSKEVPHEL